MKIFRSIGNVAVYIVFFIATWFLNVLICGIIGSLYYDGTNETAGTIYSITMLLFPFLASTFETVTFRKRLNEKQRNKTRENTESTTSLKVTNKVPSSKKKQVEIAERILANIEVCVSLANESDKVSLFVEWYDECIDGFATLMRLDKVKFQDPPSLDYYKFKDEYQWHLCDAIVRAKEKTISDIKHKYRNSREFQVRAANAFECDVNSVRNRFSIDTAALADQSTAEVQNAIGGQTHTSSDAHEIQDQFSKYGGTQAELLTIDLMEGHAFEHWCAKLLTDIGYSDVKVTQGSGDQGVDVLAAKDGIRYAIQCKCYSKDLGNGPVQEVNAGKAIYHCQIGVVMTNRYFTKGAKDAAEANGILLWDRDWIASAIKNRDNIE